MSHTEKKEAAFKGHAVHLHNPRGFFCIGSKNKKFASAKLRYNFHKTLTDISAARCYHRAECREQTLKISCLSNNHET